MINSMVPLLLIYPRAGPITLIFLMIFLGRLHRPRAIVTFYLIKPKRPYRPSEFSKINQGPPPQKKTKNFGLFTEFGDRSKVLI